MKLVNAEIKSKKELATRLMDGEVFYKGGYFKLAYEEDGTGSPFRAGSTHMNSVWDEFEFLQKEVIWYENIDKPVLCFVSDKKGCDNQNSGILVLIKSYTGAGTSNYPFDTDDNQWAYATPVSQEEASQWVVG